MAAVSVRPALGQATASVGRRHRLVALGVSCVLFAPVSGSSAGRAGAPRIAAARPHTRRRTTSRRGPGARAGTRTRSGGALPLVGHATGALVRVSVSRGGMGTTGPSPFPARASARPRSTAPARLAFESDVQTPSNAGRDAPSFAVAAAPTKGAGDRRRTVRAATTVAVLAAHADMESCEGSATTCTRIRRRSLCSGSSKKPKQQAGSLRPTVVGQT